VSGVRCGLILWVSTLILLLLLIIIIAKRINAKQCQPSSFPIRKFNSASNKIMVMNSGARRTSVNFLCVCRPTWNSSRRYKLIYSQHNVQLLPAGRPWNHSAEVPMVEEIFNNSADGMAFFVYRSGYKTAYLLFHCVETYIGCTRILLNYKVLYCLQNMRRLISLKSSSQIKYLRVVLSYYLRSNQE
jgi:hypothetical protein